MVEVIELNYRYHICGACGDSAEPHLGIPMYEDLVLPNSWDGEWFGQHVCQRCFDIQSLLIAPVSSDLFVRKSD